MDTENKTPLWLRAFDIPVTTAWVAFFTLATITSQSINGGSDSQLNKFFLQCASLASFGMLLLISQSDAYGFDIKELKKDILMLLTVIAPFAVMFLVLECNKYNFELIPIMANGYISYGLGSYISLLSFVPNLLCFTCKEIYILKQAIKKPHSNETTNDNQSPTTPAKPTKPVPMEQTKLQDKSPKKPIATLHGVMQAMLHISNVANTVSFQFFFLSFFARTTICTYSFIHIDQYDAKNTLVAIAPDALLAYMFAICAYRDSSINHNAVQ
ncbi:MAG TPA: hypothetical protein VE028_01100 [Nitratidesulfovibrio sp.]|nr:hypothetical protein [Nitratidesulfovibrio sp.]